MEVIDVLQPPYSKRPYFTVDTTKKSVPVASGGTGGTVYVWSNLIGKFSELDNIRLLSVGFYIPESFTTANPNAPIYDNIAGPPAGPAQGDMWTALRTQGDQTAGHSYIYEGLVWLDLDSRPISNVMQLSVTNTPNGTNCGWLPGFGSSLNGLFNIPFPNYELTLDLYCDMTSVIPGAYPGLAGTDFYITAALYCNDISMIGVPSALNGLIIKITPFIKIMHTRKLAITA